MLLTDAAGAWHPSLTGSGPNLQLPLSLPPPQSNGLDHGDRLEIPATPYSCQFCERNFPRLSLLKKHEQTHSDQLPFKCEYCQRLFKHKRSRDRHVKLHTGDKKYKCDQCEAAFSRSDHLKIHVKTHDSRKPFQCSLCQRGYNTGAALTSHMLNHRRESGSVSSTSSAATSLTSSRVSQSPVTSGSPATPPQSPVASNEDRRRDSGSSVGSNDGKEARLDVTISPELTIKLERPPTPANSSHEDIEPRLPTSPETLKCQYCGQDSFTSLDALGSHVQALHGPSCSALRSSSSAREQSPNVKLEERPEPLPQPRQLDFQLPFVPHLFICHMCNGRFTSLPALHQHTLSSHNLTDVLRMYYPSMVRYPNMETSASDLSNKDGENGALLTCPQCPMSFHDVENYSIHLKTHWETALRMTQGLFPPRVSCRDCGLDMTHFDPAQADAHTASHILATSVEYGCQACMKTFTKPDELQKHLLDIHAHHLYKCSLCKEVFDSKVSIQVHFAVKHSDECKLYRCTLCSTVCKSDSEFTAHVKNAHAPVMPMAPFRCKVCSEGFSVEFLLERHLQTEHGVFPGYHYFNVVNDVKCEFCSEQFPSTSVLLLHIQSAHSDDSHACSVCGEVLRSRSELDSHLKTHQPTSNSVARLKCNICDDFFGSPLELAEHKLRHYKVQGSPQCSNCKVVINSVEEYKAHTRMHTNQTPFLCIVCKQSISSDPELELHAQFHSQKVEERKCFPCMHCSSSYSNESDLREHIVSHTAVGQTLDCKLCRQSLDTPMQLQLHLIEHAHAGHSSYPCSVCHAVFTQAASLQRHTAEHSLDSRPYSCSDCSLRFYFSSELDHHSASHQQKSPREFKCDDCSQTFPSLSMLSHHRIIHDNVSSPVKCPECPATFSEGSSMIMHFRATHEVQQSSPDVKEFKCEQCGLDFPCLSNLQGHVKLHTMETCFRCDICSKDFALQRNLQIHLRSHNGERPYSCRICDKRFARKENRKAHEKSHTGVKPFACTVCARAFTRKCHLREHKKLHEKTSQSVEEVNYSSDGSDEEVNVDEL